MTEVLGSAYIEIKAISKGIDASVSSKIAKNLGAAGKAGGKALEDTIGASAKKAGKSLDDAFKGTKIQDSLKQSTKSVDALGKAQAAAADASKKFSAEQIAAQGKLVAAQKTHNDTVQAFGKNSLQARSSQNDLSAAGKRVNETLTVQDEKVGKSAKGFGKVSEAATRSVGKVGSSIGGLASLVGGTVGGMVGEATSAFDQLGVGATHGLAGAATAVAAVTVGAAVASVKMGTDFQSATTMLVTGAGESEGAISKVSDGLLAMAPKVGMGPLALAKGMFLVESAGFHGAAGLTVMAAAAETAKIGGAEATTVANALTTAMSDYHAPASAAADIASKLNATVASGKTNMSDLAGSLSAVLPAASAAHIGLSQVLGAMGTMTGEGISAQQSAQNLAGTIRALQNPSMVQTKIMGQMGLSSLDVAKNLGKQGLTGTISTLSESVLKHMGPAGTVLQSSFNTSKLAAASANEMLGKLPKSLQHLGSEFMNNQITAKTWTKALKDQPALTASLGKQFATTVKSSKGFNDSLKSGQGPAKTFSAAMSEMMGGSTGLNTALALTGTHAATFNANVKTIGSSSAEAEGHVKGWEATQKDFATQLEQGKAAVEAIGVKIGLVLIPMIQKGIKAFVSFLPVLSGLGSTVAKTLGPAFGVLGRLLTGVLIPALVGFGKFVVGAKQPLTIIAAVITALFIPALIRMAAQATISRAIMAAVWVSERADAVASTAKQAGQFVLTGARWVLSGVQAVAGAAVQGGAWAAVGAKAVAGVAVQGAQFALTGAKWVLSGVKAAAGAAVQVGAWAVVGVKAAASTAVTVAQFALQGAKWTWMGVQAMAGAARIAAAWLISLGPIGLVIAAVAAVGIFIATHMDLIKGWIGAAWKWIQTTTSAAWGWIKENLSTILKAIVIVVLGPIGLIGVLIFNNWAKIRSFTVAAWSAISAFIAGWWAGTKALFGAGLAWVRNLLVAGFLAYAGLFRGILSTLTGIWSALWAGVKSLASSAWTSLTSNASTALTGLKNLFAATVSGIRTIWSGIKKVFGEPVWFVVHSVINPLIGGAHVLLAHLGMHIPKIPEGSIPHFSAGGAIPGNHDRDDVPFFGTPGEVVVPKRIVGAFGGPNRIMSMLGIGGGGPANAAHFASGGVLGAIGGAVSGVAGSIGSGLSSLVGDVAGMVQAGAAAAFNSVVLKPLVSVAHGMDRMGPVGVGLDHFTGDVLTKLLAVIRGKESPAISAGGSGGSGPAGTSSQVKAWIAAALHADGFPMTWAGPAATLVMRESSGNPHAINLTDSNAMKGTPSKGIAQMIDSTYQRWRNPSLPNDIWNPVSNLASAFRYMKGVYGSIFHVQQAVGATPKGYASGTNNAAAGLAVVGENGPELLHFRGGEKVTSNPHLQRLIASTGPLQHLAAGGKISARTRKARAAARHRAVLAHRKATAATRAHHKATVRLTHRRTAAHRKAVTAAHHALVVKRARQRAATRAKAHRQTLAGRRAHAISVKRAAAMRAVAKKAAIRLSNNMGAVIAAEALFTQQLKIANAAIAKRPGLFNATRAALLKTATATYTLAHADERATRGTTKHTAALKAQLVALNHVKAIKAMVDPKTTAANAIGGAFQGAFATQGLSDMFNYQPGYGASSPASVIAGLRAKLALSKAFAAVLTTLAKKGLGVDMIQNLIAAGPQAGMGIATQILSDPAAILTIQNLEKQITSTTSSLGASVGKATVSVAAAAGGTALQHFGLGGLIKGTATIGNHLPVLGQPGEFVIRKSVVDSFGVPYFERLNKKSNHRNVSLPSAGPSSDHGFGGTSSQHQCRPTVNPAPLMEIHGDLVVRNENDLNRIQAGLYQLNAHQQRATGMSR